MMATGCYDGPVSNAVFVEDAAFLSALPSEERLLAPDLLEQRRLHREEHAERDVIENDLVASCSVDNMLYAVVTLQIEVEVGPDSTASIQARHDGEDRPALFADDPTHSALSGDESDEPFARNIFRP